MVKFLLALGLCMTSVGLHAAQGKITLQDVVGMMDPKIKQAQDEEKAQEEKRKQVYYMGFSYDGSWINSKLSTYGGVSVESSPPLNFRITDAGIQKLLDDAVDKKQEVSFKEDEELVSDYANILRYMKIKVEDRSDGSALKGRISLWYNYYPQYFAITLDLPLTFSRNFESQDGSDTSRPAERFKVKIGQNFNFFDFYYSRPPS